MRSSFNSRQPRCNDEEVITILALPCCAAVLSSFGRRILVKTNGPTTFVAKIVSMPCAESV
jgi:hypothetical protein